MSLVIMFYLTSSMLNMFRTLIHPSSGACDFSIISPHWSCVLVSVWLGWGGIREACYTDTTPTQPQASACYTDTTPTQPQASACYTDTTPTQPQASACYTETTPTQPHRNSNTHRNKNTRPMW